ncbi:MAG: FtsW/RodA/SpoVE family cell cycle protein, partial [Oscillospiraceae bacterium]|nr:FtsW/RodA/SpoVE family cell cycle protein [Oscillospiraceae bacterium]
MTVTRETMRPKREPMKMKLLAYGGFDFPFMLIVTVLLCLGLVMMFSASFVYAYEHYKGDSYHFIKRQALFAVVGFAAMLLISKMNLNVLRKLA